MGASGFASTPTPSPVEHLFLRDKSEELFIGENPTDICSDSVANDNTALRRINLFTLNGALKNPRCGLN